MSGYQKHSIVPAGTRIRYMGNKVALAHHVGALIEQVEEDWPLVDLFGGMCSVAGAVSQSGRSVVVNDVQRYARLVASCLLASHDGPPDADVAMRAVVPAYRANLAALRERFNEDIKRERQVLASASPKTYRAAQEAWRHVGNDAALSREAADLRRKHLVPYRLATITFAWGYFGVRQATEIDSIRAGIDSAGTTGALSEEDVAWCRLALLQACSRVVSAPGHFAQFLRGDSETGLRRILASRRRSVWDAFLADLSALEPYGSSEWRSGNQVLTEDALEIWPTLDERLDGPAIFYADPPYSKEQYSRFYHVLETLERYDYPPAAGIGRYRPDRFVTPLATRRGVVAATMGLCAQVAARDGILVLSYPSTGLLTRDLGIAPGDLLGEYFDDVDLAVAVPQQHSTLGGRHGAARREVTEYVWVAR